LILDDAIHDDHLRRAIYRAIPRVTLQAAVKETYRLRRPNGYFDFLDDEYSYVRQFTPRLLDTLSFASHQDDHPVLEGLAVLRTLNTTRRCKLPDDAPIDFIPDQWRRFVMPGGQPDRPPYELCVLSTLRDALRSGDIFFPIVVAIRTRRHF
jgi:hypothetical protein